MKRFFTLLFLLIGTTVLMAQSTTKELRVSVFFASASHTPTASELAKLTDFSTDLTSYADYSLKIEAFTDEQGTPDYNDALAKRRAKAITEALANHTVIANSTEVLSYGELQARANTINDAERQQDRRVDLVATVTQWADATAALNTIRKAQKQAITITNPSARQSFRGRQGGVFMLEPNSLVRPDGSLAKGPVSINLVEAYDLSDMLLAGLTTTAAGKRLVTGGMINLTATDADGVELELREGAAMTASIPTDDFNERMRIFSGAGHNATGTPTDWDLTEGGVAASAEGLFAAAPTEPDVVNIAVDARKLVGPQLARWRVANPKPKEPRYVNPNTIYVRAPKPINLDRVKYHKPKGLRGLFTSKAKVEKETEAKKKDVKEKYERRLTRYQERLAYRERLPEVNEEKRLDYEQRLAAWETAFNLAKEGLLEQANTTLFAAAKKRIEAMRAARAARLAALGKELAGLDDLTGREASVRRYFFSVTDLGWANVDIFYDAEKKVEVLASVTNSTSDASVIMVPADRPSVLAYVPGEEGEWKRSGIPVGVGYHVVAYQVINGQLMLAHHFVPDASKQKVSLNYSPVAISDLKGKLAEILGS